MAIFIIQEQGKDPKRFKIEKNKTVIGRDASADIVIPNMTISRSHVLIHRRNYKEYEAENQSKDNLMLINGHQKSTHQLSTDDIIQLGRFSLHFYGDEVIYGETTYEQTPVLDIPIYDPIAEEDNEKQLLNKGAGKSKIRKWLQHTHDKSTSNLSQKEARDLLTGGMYKI